MKNETGMAIVHVGKICYLVDVQAYYLACELQQIKFGFENSVPEDSKQKEKMFLMVLDWMVENNKATKLERRPNHLIIKLDGY